jgi:protein-L-isoaspartate(D-aspartate) O-methyltransferase
MTSIDIPRLSPRAHNIAGAGLTSQRARDRMLERLHAQGIQHPNVLAAMGSVPRHLFVDEGLQSRAYEDTALPIGMGQTISQPWVVARMCELLLLHFDAQHRAPETLRVLEIGTGCGYQAAVLSALLGTVYTVERIDELLRHARRRLRHQGRENIRSAHADGTLGWPSEAPFDAALVAAGGLALTPDFFAQIAANGVVIAPVGDQQAQTLKVFHHSAHGWQGTDVAQVFFVPLLQGVV